MVGLLLMVHGEYAGDKDSADDCVGAVVVLLVLVVTALQTVIMLLLLILVTGLRKMVMLVLVVVTRLVLQPVMIFIPIVLLFMVYLSRWC